MTEHEHEQAEEIRMEVAKALGIDSVGGEDAYVFPALGTSVNIVLGVSDTFPKKGTQGFIWAQHETGSFPGQLSFWGSPVHRFSDLSDTQTVVRTLIVPFRKALYELDKSTLTEEQQQFIMKLMG